MIKFNATVIVVIVYCNYEYAVSNFLNVLEIARKNV